MNLLAYVPHYECRRNHLYPCPVTHEHRVHLEIHHHLDAEHITAILVAPFNSLRCVNRLGDDVTALLGCGLKNNPVRPLPQIFCHTNQIIEKMLHIKFGILAMGVSLCLISIMRSIAKL